MLGFVLGEAARDLSRAGRVVLAAVLLMTLSFGALGAFWLLSLNLERAVGQWRERVRVVAFLRAELEAPQAEKLVGSVQGWGGVQRVRYVSKAEALATLRASLGAQADVADSLPRNPLPASLEVTPDAARTTPDATRALAERLAILPEVEEVQGGTEWVERLAQWSRLVRLAGLGVGAVLALAAILTVTTATTLVLHVRRDEIEIMRLVGATEAVIRLPLLVQGAAQGLAGALVALAVLEVGYALVVPRVEPLLDLTLGLGRVVFFSAPQMLILLGGGAGLGALGGLLSKGRPAA